MATTVIILSAIIAALWVLGGTFIMWALIDKHEKAMSSGLVGIVYLLWPLLVLAALFSSAKPHEKEG